MEKEHLLKRVSKERIAEMEQAVLDSEAKIKEVIKECSELKAKQIDWEAKEERKQVQKFIGGRLADRPNDDVMGLITQYRNKISHLE